MQILPLIMPFLICGIGLIIGSFLAAYSHRLPRHIDTIFTPSACPHCHTCLGICDLIPVFSFLLALGKCRHCSAAISWRYPLIELASALGLLLVFQAFGLHDPLFYLYSLLWCITLLIIVIDLEHYLIPDRLNMAFFLLNIIALWHRDSALWPALGIALLLAAGFWLLGYLISRAKGQQALGFGDIKLLCGLGLLLLPISIIAFLFLSGMLGVLLGLAWRFWRQNVHFPFAPALLGAWGIILIMQEKDLCCHALLHAV